MGAQEDRAKAIDGLRACEWLMQSQDYCMRQGCPYLEHRHNGDCLKVLHDDVLDMLKAQEAKPVHVTAEINYRKVGECPNCDKVINSGDYPNYCGQCGQAVKWE